MTPPAQLEIIEKATAITKEVKSLGASENDLAKLQKNIEGIPEGSKTQVLDAVKKQLGSAKFQAEQLKLIDENLVQLKSRVKERAKPLVAGIQEELNQQRERLLKAEAERAAEEAAKKAPTGESPTLQARAEEIGNDFWQGGMAKKAGYAAGTIAGFLGLRWMWQKLFGDKKADEGWVKKIGRWIAGAGGGGARHSGYQSGVRCPEDAGSRCCRDGSR